MQNKSRKICNSVSTLLYSPKRIFQKSVQIDNYRVLNMISSIKIKFYSKKITSWEQASHQFMSFCNSGNVMWWVSFFSLFFCHPTTKTQFMKDHTPYFLYQNHPLRLLNFVFFLTALSILEKSVLVIRRFKRK